MCVCVCSESEPELSGESLSSLQTSEQFESAHSEKRVMGVCAVGIVVRAHVYVIEQYSEAEEIH